MLYDTDMENRRLLTALAAVLLIGTLGLSGCNSSPSMTELTELERIARDTEFLDDVESNREDDGTLGSLQFVDTEGKTVTLDSYRNQKNLLVVTKHKEFDEVGSNASGRR